MREVMYLDGEMPVVVLERNIELRNARVFNEDTGRWWWVHVSRLTPVAAEDACASDSDGDSEDRVPAEHDG